MSKKRFGDYDDGRVIAPMNIDGMPWYRRERRPRDTAAFSGDAEAGGASGDRGDSMLTGSGAGSPVRLTRRENIAFSFGVIKAVMLIAIVYIAVMLGFILFCTNVWFR